MTSAFSWQNCQPLTHFVLYSKVRFACYSLSLISNFLLVFCDSILGLTRESKGIPDKPSAYASLAMLKLLTAWFTANCGKFLEMGIPDHFTFLLRNLYAGQEATVRTGHGTTVQFQIGKGVHQGCILSLCLFNLYTEYIMHNANLYGAEAGIKIARRIINNLRYADDTTLVE